MIKEVWSTAGDIARKCAPSRDLTQFTLHKLPVMVAMTLPSMAIGLK
jgi:hypothetical protein